MKKKNLYSLLTLAVVFVFIFSLFRTVNVLADDSTPPAPTDAPIVDVTPTDIPVVTEVPVTTETPAEDISIPEALAQLPEGTDVVVLDQNGEALPLVSSEAAEVLATADPYFWDGTQYVGYSASGLCPLVVTVCNTDSSPIQAAVDAFGISGTASGYIYVEAAGSPYAENVVVDGTYNSGYLANLDGIIGGGSSSTTNNGSFEFYNMNTFTFEGFRVNGNVWFHDNSGTLTLNDLIVTNAAGSGIVVEDHAGDVNLTNVTANYNLYNGAHISNTGDVSVTDSSFNWNTSTGQDMGLEIDSDGDVTLNGVSANNNWAGDGSDIYSFSSLSIQDSVFKYNYSNVTNWGYGLYISDGYGDVNLTNVEASGNETNGADFTAGAYIGTDGDVTITNGTFNGNVDNGLVVDNSGNITITNVTATGNSENGADLSNDCGCLNGSITISNSSFNDNSIYGNGRGLIAHSNSDITLTNVEASGNGGGGAELENCFPSSIFSSCMNTNLAQITISDSVFNDNGYVPPDISWLFGGGGPFYYGSVGLWAESTGNLTLNGVTADGNGLGNLGGGAFLLSENGNLFVANSNFNGNCGYYCDFLGFGLMAIDMGGDITFDRVTANANGNEVVNDPSTGLGAIVLNLSGNTLVKNSDFSGNCTLDTCFGGGIFVLSFGDVYFDHVNANGNGADDGIGAVIETGGNIDIYCSSFNNNAGYGLQADTSGTVTLNGVTVTGNGVGDIDLTGGTLVVNPFDCNPEGSKVALPNLPLKVVNVTSGQAVGLDCEHFGGTKLILENGNSTTLPCPIDDSASIIDNNKIEDLPKPLPEGVTFKSAFTTSVTQNGEKLGKLINSAVISFVIPEGVDVSKLAILFWDGSEWTEVKNTYVRNDPVTGESYFEAFVNETGTFVLVQK